MGLCGILLLTIGGVCGRIWVVDAVQRNRRLPMDLAVGVVCICAKLSGTVCNSRGRRSGLSFG